MRKAMMMGVLVVLGGLTSARGALLSGNTLDHMGWSDSQAFWYESSGSWWGDNWDGALLNDPNDPESPQVALQRTGPFYFGYRAEAGKVFSTVLVGAATHGYVTEADGSDRLTLAWAIGESGFTVLTPDAITDIGATAGGWRQYVYSYDLGGLSADRVRIIPTDPLDYSPMISSVKLGVVPEPASLLLVMCGGLSAICRRKG